MAHHETVISLRKKLLFSGVILVGFFGLVEGFLVLAGIGKANATSDPYVGFSNQHPLFVNDPTAPDTHVRTAENKLVWFNDQRFSREKPLGVRRVFCVGGSTTYGRPYNDTTSFCGWLREFLPLVDDRTEWEVINAGGVSYASYRVAAVMEEICQYEPDLFIVYSGQNEFLERRTYAGMFDQPRWQRNATALLAKTRTFSVLKQLIKPDLPNDPTATPPIMLPGEVDEILNHTVGPSEYHRDPQWQSDVLQHYRANLQRMKLIAQEAGAGIVMVVPASNEKDCSPFKSEAAPTLSEPQRAQFEQLVEAAGRADGAEQALAPLQAARRIDSGYADIDYEIGKQLFELASFPEAAISFQAAVDNDVCPLRATRPLQTAVRGMSEASGVMVVDFDQKLRDQCHSEYGHAILGNAYFLDHVHPTIEVHQQLALWIMERLQQERWISANQITASQIESVDREVRARIDTVASGVAFRNLTKVLHWSGKFNEAIPCARDALRLLPNDPESLLLLADCLWQTHQSDEAIKLCERLIDVAPTYARGYLLLGELLFDRQQHERAEEVLSFAAFALPAGSERQLRAQFLLGVTYVNLNNLRQADPLLSEVHRFYPQDLATTNYLAQTKAALGETDAAIELYQQILQQSPMRIDAQQRLGLLFMQDGRIKEARECFERIIKIDPNNSDAIMRLKIVQQLLEKAAAEREASSQQEVAR